MIGWGSRRGRQTLRPVPLMKFFWFAIHAPPSLGGKHTHGARLPLCVVMVPALPVVVVLRIPMRLTPEMLYLGEEQRHRRERVPILPASSLCQWGEERAGAVGVRPSGGPCAPARELVTRP